MRKVSESQSDLDLTIQSHRGPYRARFAPLWDGLQSGLPEKSHLTIDAKVARLYADPLSRALAARSVLKIEATEENKSLEKIPNYIEHLLQQGIRRGDTLIAVGGGIIQDIAAFIAAVLFRGLDWKFYPTTLLAQADSCIGGKSSINVCGYKNQVGTFTPPQEIWICPEVLATLEEKDVCSGIGEIIKVHWIAGESDFCQIQADYPKLQSDPSLLLQKVRRALEIKKQIIEIDEFDQKERLVLNYGHTFGHAIESATHYEIPHGIAVTMGMDMANYLSWQLGLLSEAGFKNAHALLQKNYAGFEKVAVPFRSFLDSIAKDKKNVGGDIALLLTRGPGEVFRHRIPNAVQFQSLCEKYLFQQRHIT